MRLAAAVLSALTAWLSPVLYSYAQQPSILTSPSGTLAFRIAEILVEPLKSQGTALDLRQEPQPAERLRLLANRGGAFALVSSDLVYFASTGQDPFSQQPLKSLAGVAALYPLDLHLLARRDRAVRTPADLIGKTIAIGTPSPSERVFRDAFGVLGTQVKSLTSLSPAESLGQLAAGRQDAVAFFDLAPNLFTRGLLTNQDLFVMLSFPEAVTRRVYPKLPYVHCATVGRETYPMLPQPVSTVALPIVLVSDQKVPEDLVYRVTKTLFDKRSEISALHPAMRNFDVKRARRAIGVGIHPGAAKYYRELLGNGSEDC